MKIDIKKLNIRKLLPIILFISVLVLIIGAFTFLRPESPKELELKTSYTGMQNIKRIDDVPGVTNIKRLSDSAKNLKNLTNRVISQKSERVPAPLPYPRISISYTFSRVSSIRGETANNSVFIIVTLDIKNYGYQYFDAHPKKFRLVYIGREIEPIVTISTGNILEEVLPNNSRVKGDLVFLLDKKGYSGIPKIRYIDSGYTILFDR